VVVTSIIGGIISDHTGRRKMLVTVSGLLMAAAALLLAFWETWPSALAAATLYGMGYGAYIAVDQALITQVLPNPEDRGKDLGIINIANNLPYVLAGGLGGLIIDGFGRDRLGYPVLFGLSLVTALLAALTVRPIKSVR
jgi:MFS family permease